MVDEGMTLVSSFLTSVYDSGRVDSNQRPLDPQATLNERDNCQNRILRAAKAVCEHSEHSQDGKELYGSHGRVFPFDFAAARPLTQTTLPGRVLCQQEGVAGRTNGSAHPPPLPAQPKGNVHYRKSASAEQTKR